MSVKTWKEEFYSPINKSWSPRKTLEHALKKWGGAREENRKKHGLTKTAYADDLHDEVSKEVFEFGIESCAVCMNRNNVCAYCIIGNCHKAYGCWWGLNDPEPIIKMIEQALKSFPSYRTPWPI